MVDTGGTGKLGKKSAYMDGSFHRSVPTHTHFLLSHPPLLCRALKANTTHPDLDTITRCHNYDISYKYSYKCTRCDYKYVRITMIQNTINCLLTGISEVS